MVDARVTSYISQLHKEKGWYTYQEAHIDVALAFCSSSFIHKHVGQVSGMFWKAWRNLNEERNLNMKMMMSNVGTSVSQTTERGA